MRVSNSKIRTYRRCPNKYRYRYGMKLRPKAKALPLEMGSWLHTLLQYHYDGKDWREAHKRLVRQYTNLPDEVREDILELPEHALRIIRSYLRRYRQEDAARFQVVDSEMDEIITLPNGLKLQIIVDLIMEDTLEGGLWVWDHKFRGKLGDPDDMLLDPQLTLYYWGLEHMGYTPLRGAMYNEVRTKAPTVPQVLASGALSKRKDADTDVYTYMQTIRKHALDPADYADILQLIAQKEHDRFFRRTRIPKDPPAIKTTMKELVDTAKEIQRAEHEQRFPRTFDTSCKFHCEYKNLCIAELHGANIDTMIRQNFEVSTRGQE